MNTLFGWFTRSLSRPFAATCAVILCLGATSPVFAEAHPDIGPPPGPTGSGGTRGCYGISDTPLIALAPQGSSLGQTISTHPTFAWYMPESDPFPLEFRLYQYDSTGELQPPQIIELQSSPGITSLTLPADQPGLEVGQRYRWQVVLICDPDNRASDVFVFADIQVVGLHEDLSLNPMATSEDYRDRINFYVNAGLWYDAWQATLEADETSLKETQLALLEHLAEIEEEAVAEQLRQVIEVERSSQ